MAVIEFKVTQEDIEKGKRCISHSCPIALSVARTLGISPQARRNRISIGSYEMEFVKDGHRIESATPNAAVRFMDEFDHCEPVEPFKFKVRYRQPKVVKP